MCIISGPIMTVRATKIYCQPSLDGSRQLVVYSNMVQTEATNLMVLPVPYPETVEFETVPREFWRQCRESFVPGVSAERSGWWVGTQGPEIPAYMEVLTHGSYEVALAHTVEDLGRLRPDFAHLDPGVLEFLATAYGGVQNYGKRYGFLVCRLKPGATEYEPFAYSHARRSSGDMFVPTMHFHRLATGGGEVEIATADWDHEIYSLGTGPEANSSRWDMPHDRNAIDWNEMPVKFRLGPGVPMRKLTRQGSGQNRDTWLSTRV